MRTQVTDFPVGSRVSPRLHKVLDPDLAALRESIQRLTGVSRKFPGPSPCSIERADFPKLRLQPYWVCEKTDGVRVLFVCDRIGDKTIAWIVTRAMDCFLLPLKAIPTALYQGTVVDCELAFNKTLGVWTLLAFDAFVLSGIPVHGLPFSRRITCLGRSLTLYSPDPDDPVRVCVKDFSRTLTDVYMTLLVTKRISYDVDGLILTPELTRPSPGRCPDLYKFKTCHTVDFVVGSDGLSLSVFKPTGHVVVERLDTPATPGAIVECRQAGGSWVVVCVRGDKDKANDYLTYSKTLINAAEAITEQELMDALT